MSRLDEALTLLQGTPGEGWEAVHVSVRLRCAPAQARAALDELVRRGVAIQHADGQYEAGDVRGEILRLLTAAQPHGLEYTAIGVAEALPDLCLTEALALHHLTALAAEEKVEAWFSLLGDPPEVQA